MASLISCLIPVYNGEKYLALALDSILNQTFQDFEIIVVDDGSTDKSHEILAAFAKKHSKIQVRRKENGGIVDALNHGLKFCTGKYIARMDCDDIAIEDRFETQISEFEKQKDAVAVGGYIRGMDESGNIAPGMGISPSRVTKTNLDTFPPIVANVQHSAGMFLRSAMQAVGGYRATFPHAEDYDLYLRLAPFGRFYNPPKAVIFYRQHNESVSARNLLLQETSAALSEMSAYARKLGLDDPGDEKHSLNLIEYNELLGDDLCPFDTMSRYIEFRMYRRLNPGNLPGKGEYGERVKRGILSFRSYKRKKDIQLNVRIVLSYIKSRLTMLPIFKNYIEFIK